MASVSYLLCSAPGGVRFQGLQEQQAGVSAGGQKDPDPGGRWAIGEDSRCRVCCPSVNAFAHAVLRVIPAGLMSCTFFLAANGLYSSSDDVIELTPTNFNREVIQSDSLWLVEFYAPW